MCSLTLHVHVAFHGVSKILMSSIYSTIFWSGDNGRVLRVQVMWLLVVGWISSLKRDNLSYFPSILIVKHGSYSFLFHLRSRNDPSSAAPETDALSTVLLRPVCLPEQQLPISTVFIQTLVTKTDFVVHYLWCWQISLHSMKLFKWK